MNFNKHLDFKGHHAVLSPSSYNWIRYTDKERFARLLRSREAVKKGIEDHEFACTCIQRRQRLPKTKKTLNMYVNDAIGFRMIPEQVLFFSENCFGTADAISYNERKKFLRIHDLKTGESPASMDQLMIYAGIFSLEYEINPKVMDVELRIYQNNDIFVLRPEDDELTEVIDQIILGNKWINELKEEAEWL